MKQIKYTPDAAEKLRNLNRAIATLYGTDTAKKIIRKITSTIRSLSHNEKMGPAVQSLFPIVSDYRYIFISRNYVFYRIESDCIRIINIYNEKEDFMWQLFGIDTTPEETNAYWNE